MKLYPIAMTTIHWESFISNVQFLTGTSPTRGHDIEGFDIKDDPASLLGAIDLRNRPGYALKNARDLGLLRLVHFNLMAVIPTGLVTDLVTKTDIELLCRDDVHDGLWLMAGSLEDWRMAAEVLLSDQASRDERIFANQLLAIFATTKLREVFKFRLRVMPDGTKAKY